MPFQIRPRGDSSLAMHQAERRKSRRFPLKQAAYLRVVDGPSPPVSAMTQNVSKNGVMLIADSAVPVGAQTELILVLESRLERSIRLSGACKVVRVQETNPPGRFEISFNCDHAFSMMD